MPPVDAFDAARIRETLWDLLRTTQTNGERCTLRLERVKEEKNGIVIQGQATRIAFIRLCLMMADRALEKSSVTLIEDADIYRVDIASEGEDLRVIEIFLTDDPLVERRPIEPNFRKWGRLRGFFFGFVPLFIFVWILITGLVANLWLVWGVSGALLEIAQFSLGHR